MVEHGLVRVEVVFVFCVGVVHVQVDVAEVRGVKRFLCFLIVEGLLGPSLGCLVHRREESAVFGASLLRKCYVLLTVASRAFAASGFRLKLFEPRSDRQQVQKLLVLLVVDQLFLDATVL